MTVSPQSLHLLKESVQYLHEQGHRFTANLATGVDWGGSGVTEIYCEQLLDLVDYYIAHPDLQPIRLLGLPLWHIVPEVRTQMGVRKMCGTGTAMVCYMPDGQRYPCHLFAPSANRASIQAVDVDLRDPASIVSEKCRSCLLLPVCPTCYGMNYARFGSVAHRDEKECEFTKIQAMAASYMYARMLLSGGDHAVLACRTKSVLEALRKSVLLVQRAMVQENWSGPWSCQTSAAKPV